jgi:hypothetical protein
MIWSRIWLACPWAIRMPFCSSMMCNNGPFYLYFTNFLPFLQRKDMLLPLTRFLMKWIRNSWASVGDTCFVQASHQRWVRPNCWRHQYSHARVGAWRWWNSELRYQFVHLLLRIKQFDEGVCPEFCFYTSFSKCIFFRPSIAVVWLEWEVFFLASRTSVL